jgi:hypothetical protein
MSQYPINTPAGVYNAVNYLVSSPQSNGQNFSGLSTYAPGYVTNNYRVPYNSTVPVPVYVAPIACSQALQLSDNTFKMVFSTTQTSPPFIPGNAPTGAGWTNSFYNGSWAPIGIIECTVDYIILKTSNKYPGIGDDLTGGTIELDSMGSNISTDLNSKVTATAATDRIFISSQLNQMFTYTATAASDLTLSVQINRYQGYPNNDPTSPGFYFLQTATILEKNYTYSGLTATGTENIETIFTTAIDNPGPGYYWYITELNYSSTGTSIVVNQVQTGLRSFTLQVIKQ